MNTCQCCQRLYVVLDENGKWFCFYCDVSNNTSWVCPCVSNNIIKEPAKEPAKETAKKSVFIKYPSLTNAHVINKNRRLNEVAPDSQWFLFEKLHGANFQICVSRDESGEINISFASRTLLLDEKNKSSFYDFSESAAHLKQSATNLINSMPTAKTLNIYGELYGSNIQKEITYNKNQRMFRVFDVIINKEQFMPYHMFDHIEKVGFDIISIIKTGLLNDLLQLPTEFKSLYSPFNEGAEGYTIKHISSDGKHYAIKNKAPSFVECHTGKKIQPSKAQLKQLDLSSFNDPNIKLYILNKNRLNTLFSKIGPPSKSTNINNITRQLINDAINDYIIDHNTDDNIVKSSDVKHYAYKSYFHEALSFVNEQIR